MKLYWYKLNLESITEEEVEVKETAKLYKVVGSRYFPHDAHSTINKALEGKVLDGWKGIFVFFTEKNIEKARDLFVESQKSLINHKRSEIANIETEIEKLERQIERLEDMEAKNG